MATLAGGVLPLAFSPFGFHLLAFLSPGLLLLLWHGANTRATFYIGYVYGLAFFGIGVNWLHISINTFGNIGLFFAWLLTFLLCSVLALYPALVGVLAKYLWRDRHDAINYLCLLPACWLLMEWWRGWFLTGFPWLNLGASQTDSLLSAYLPLLGVYGTSLVMMVAVGAGVLLCLGRARKPAVVTLISIIAIGLTTGHVEWTRPGEQKLEIALVQGAIPQELKWHPSMREVSTQLYTGLSMAARDSELLIWPETAFTKTYHKGLGELRQIKAQFSPHTTFLVGLVYADEKQYQYNSILLMDDRTRLYHKHHLVPFGEYFPLPQIVKRFLEAHQVPLSDLRSSRDNKHHFITRHGVLGLSICYEVAFGQEIRKAMPAAELLINLANDAWFGDSIAPHQHLQIAQVRALETGRYLLRATNTGISAIIDQKGRIKAKSPQFQQYLLQGEAIPYRGSTPFVLLGNWPVVAYGVLVLLISRGRKYFGKP